MRCYVQVRRLGAELDASVFSLKSKNKLRARLATLVQKVITFGVMNGVVHVFHWCSFQQALSCLEQAVQAA